MSFVDRVASRSADVRVAQILLSVLAVPFYVVGFVVGVLWLAVRWVVAAVVVGWADVIGDKAEAVEADDAG